MPKESGKIESKTTVSKETLARKDDVDKVLIENFVSLQKVMTNLAVKFDGLSTQISKLLELFEISAKALAEKDYSLGENTEDKKVVEKLDNLLAQNKVIAKGIAMLHESNMSSQQQPLVNQPYSQPNEIRPATTLPPSTIPSNYSRPVTKPLSPEKNFSDSRVKPMNF